MDFKEIMKQKRGYCSKHTDMPSELQLKAKELCWEYNQTGPSEKEKRSNILKELLGTCCISNTKGRRDWNLKTYHNRR